MSAARRVLGNRVLGELLRGHAAIAACDQRVVGGLASDSRRVAPGALFFARVGAQASGEDFIDAALAAGAVAVVREGAPAVRVLGDGAVEVRVNDIGACMADVARRFHDDPAAALELVGVTGTNGKTSVSHFIAAVLHRPGSEPCGLLGTLGGGLFGALQAGLHTTPDVLDVHAALAGMRDAGATRAVMEVSSHALDQGRVRGVGFDVAVFTNLSRDHLDYHADMDDYGRAKQRLFETDGLRHAVLNLDDSHGRVLAARIAPRVPLLGYSLEVDADAAIRGEILALGTDGLRMAVTTPWGTGEIHSRLAGRFNAANLLAALATLGALGVPLARVLDGLARVAPPPGRMERLGGGVAPLAVVDYAHTPDALATVLTALRPQCRGRLWCVFGCGGDRDRGKRPLMGQAAERLADHVIVTDDNPRGEDGDLIVADILAGMQPATARVERDRTTAIGMAIGAAAAGDVVLVAGKGHEPYQEIDGHRLPFSDIAAVRAALARREGGRTVINLPLHAAARLCSGTVTGADVTINGVSSDSRALSRDALFVALQGPNFDGHDYVGVAGERGAAAAMVSRAVDANLPTVRVADTRLGLGALAAGWRASHELPVVAITGSNGKTTVKEMVAAVLSARGPVLATHGNLNNDIGVPLTLLRLGAEHTSAVLEMGANHAGEIAALCALARPHVGVVTLCAPAHLEGFGSIEGVARAKGEMFSALPADGVAVINQDDAFAGLWRELAAPRRVLGFGFGVDADVRGDWRPGGAGAGLRVQSRGESVDVALQLLGRHNAANALAALAVAVALDMSMAAAASALASVVPVPGRLQTRRGVAGIRVIDDTYNANPSSLLAALDVLASFPTPRVLVLGNMAELGENAADFHAQAGHAARAAGVQSLHALGDLTHASVDAFGAGAVHHATLESLLESLSGGLAGGATVLVKGSRSMRMERAVAALVAEEVS